LLKRAQEYFLPQGAGYPSYATGSASEQLGAVSVNFEFMTSEMGERCIRTVKELSRII